MKKTTARDNKYKHKDRHKHLLKNRNAAHHRYMHMRPSRTFFISGTAFLCFALAQRMVRGREGGKENKMTVVLCSILFTAGRRQSARLRGADP